MQLHVQCRSIKYWFRRKGPVLDCEFFRTFRICLYRCHIVVYCLLRRGSSVVRRKSTIFRWNHNTTYKRVYILSNCHIFHSHFTWKFFVRSSHSMGLASIIWTKKVLVLAKTFSEQNWNERPHGVHNLLQHWVALSVSFALSLSWCYYDSRFIVWRKIERTNFCGNLSSLAPLICAFTQICDALCVISNAIWLIEHSMNDFPSHSWISVPCMWLRSCTHLQCEKKKENWTEIFLIIFQ